jgi:hypothetical protein
LGFLGVLLGVPRGSIEEGGTNGALWGNLSAFLGVLVGVLRGKVQFGDLELLGQGLGARGLVSRELK